MGSQKVYGPRLGAVDVFHKAKKFFVKENGVVKSVQNAFVDKKLRNIPTKSLNKFLKKNYLAVKKMNDGEYSIGARVRGLGGGPIAAGVGYWLTKAVCYGTAAFGATTLVVATAGTGVGLVTGVAATSAAATTAAGLTVAGVSAAGGVAATVGAIESAALSVGAICAWLPTP